MELPQPPQDQELKNIIDKLAQFVARNGPEFEQMTKTKQKDNPKFSFLFGGDYFNYYQYKVTTEQAILKHRQSRDQNHNPPQQQMPPPNMGRFSGSPGPRFNPPFPYQPYPPASGFGGDGGQYPPGVVMGNYQQPHQSLPYQMPIPPGSEPSHPMTSAPSQTSMAPTQNFRPPFPPGDPSYNSFNAPPEDMYNPPHNVFQPPLPPPASMPESFSPQAMMGPPGADHPGPNSFQRHGPPIPPPPGDPGPVPVPGGIPTQMPMPAPGIDTSLESLNFQQQQLRQQIEQSEQNLEAQCQAIEQQKHAQVLEGVYMARGELLKKEANELGLNIQEFEDVLTPITESCTKDSIANGKHWIFTHALSDVANKWISQYLLYKATRTSGPFTHKLHIIYLMNDVLHHCVRKNAGGLKDSLERVLGPMYCHAVSTASDDQKAKLDKLLNLWESKMNLEEDILHHLHSPIDSWAAFEKHTLQDFPHVISAVSQHLMSTFENYQQQHNAFVQHATNQLHQLEQQKQHHHHQALQQGPHGPPGTFGPPMGPQHQFLQTGPGGPPQPLGQGMDFNQPPPGFHSGGAAPAPGSVPPMIDFSKPPPGFGTEEPKENLVPTVPYFELPAGLMAPLISIEDNRYKPIDPALLRLPLPTPPSERLLRAVENFYQPPSHDRPRNCEGWEQLALYDYYKAKSQAIKEKERLISEGLRDRSRSPSPITIEPTVDLVEPKPQGPFRRYRSVSPLPEEEQQIVEMQRRKKSPSPETTERENRENRKNAHRQSHSRSPPSSRYRSPQQNFAPAPRSPKRSRSGSRSRSRSASRSLSRSKSRSRSRSKSPVRIPYRKSRSRSITPPSFGMPSFKRSGSIDESNKGLQMLRSMGWSGSGLGAKEQGISTPISAAEVRETPQERFRGLGVPSAQSDPYEAFRKNKGQAFINRMKARAEEKH